MSARFLLVTRANRLNYVAIPAVVCRRWAALSLTACALGAWCGDAWACSVCGCGDPLLIASDPAAINGVLRLQLDAEYLRMDAGNDEQPGYTDRLTQWSYRLNVAYRPIKDLAFSATLPLLQKAIHTLGGGTDTTASNLTGFGDVEVTGRYAFFRSLNLRNGRLHDLAVTFGSTLPTGRYNALASDGSLIDPHGQIGTGAWGPFVGLSYRLEQGRWLGFASVSARLRTQATYVDGSKYKFGNALYYGAHGQYWPGSALALDLGVDGRYAAVDQATGATGAVENSVPNTGGTVVSLAPGAYVNPVGQLWIFARAQIPFYEHLLGEQNVYPTLAAGIQYQLF